MIAQSVILLGVVAVIIANDPRPLVRRWGCIAGLIAQPAWFWAAWDAGQWGVFIGAVFYTYGWMRGVWYQWVRPAR